MQKPNRTPLKFLLLKYRIQKYQGEVMSKGSRLEKLQNWIKKSAESISYDRTMIQKPNYVFASQHEGDAIIKMPPLNVIVEGYKHPDFFNKPFGGVCREISCFVAARLTVEEIVDGTEVRAAVKEATNEYHYVVIAHLEGKKYLVDLAYSQPVLLPVPFGENLEDESWEPKADHNNQIYGGKVAYIFCGISDRIPGFTISQGERIIKKFDIVPLTEAIDRQIMRRFFCLTGNVYKNRTTKNKNGKFNLSRTRLDGGLLPTFHKIAKDGNLEVIIKK
jgi:hypothetical protein